jgi:hypothetical protein
MMRAPCRSIGIEIATALFLALMVSVAAQVGTEICACQPSQYTMILNFALECDDKDIDESVVAGVQETACVVEGTVKDMDLTDPFPVLVRNITITELDQELQPVKQDRLSGEFLDGAEISYTSFTAAEPGRVDPTSLPAGLQVELTGSNAGGELLKNIYVILFNQNCSIYPVLTDGMQIGWTVFVRLMSHRFRVVGKR